MLEGGGRVLGAISRRRKRGCVTSILGPTLGATLSALYMSPSLGSLRVSLSFNFLLNTLYHSLLVVSLNLSPFWTIRVHPCRQPLWGGNTSRFRSKLNTSAQRSTRGATNPDSAQSSGGQHVPIPLKAHSPWCWLNRGQHVPIPLNTRRGSTYRLS